MSIAVDQHNPFPRRDLLLIFLLIAATSLVYWKCLENDFLVNWDDNFYIRRNPFLTFSIENVRHVFTSFYEVKYCPLQMISYMADFALWGMNPAGFHATNLIIHSMNVVFFYILLVRLTGLRRGAFIAGLIFAVHPVQVETVAWVSQRNNLLAMFFFLASFLYYHEYREKNKQTRLNYTVAGFLILLAMLSKPIAVFIPVVLLTYDVWFRQDRTISKSITINAPFFALAAIFSWIGYIANGSEGERIGNIGGSAFMTFLNYLPAFSKYLILLLCPLNLNVIYNGPIKTSIDMQTVLSAAIILLFAAGWYLVHRRRKDLSFWLSLFVVPLLPVSGIIPQASFMNDRYLYFPITGFAGFIAFGLWSESFLSSEYKMRRPIDVAGVFLILCLGFLSNKRVAVWHDSVTLWSESLKTAPEGTWYNFNSNFIEKSLAEGYVAQGRDFQRSNQDGNARRAYLLALSYDDSSYGALSSLTSLYLAKGMPRQALPYAERFATTYSHLPGAYLRLAEVHMAIGESEKAKQDLMRAAEIDPNNKAILNALNYICKLNYSTR